MIRRAGHFRRQRQAIVAPQLEDVGIALESKWRQWAERESFKRSDSFWEDVLGANSFIALPSICAYEIHGRPCLS